MQGTQSLDAISWWYKRKISRGAGANKERIERALVAAAVSGLSST